MSVQVTNRCKTSLDGPRSLWGSDESKLEGLRNYSL